MERQIPVSIGKRGKEECDKQMTYEKINIAFNCKIVFALMHKTVRKYCSLKLECRTFTFKPLPNEFTQH